MTLNDSTSVKEKLQKDLNKAVLEKRFKDAGTIQINIAAVEKLQIELKNAVDQGRYKEAADLEDSIKKFSSDFNSTKEQAQSEIFACIKPKKRNNQITGYECSFVDEKLGFPCNARGRLLESMKNHVKNTHN